MPKPHGSRYHGPARPKPRVLTLFCACPHGPLCAITQVFPVLRAGGSHFPLSQVRRLRLGLSELPLGSCWEEDSGQGPEATFLVLRLPISLPAPAPPPLRAPAVSNARSSVGPTLQTCRGSCSPPKCSGPGGEGGVGQASALFLHPSQLVPSLGLSAKPALAGRPLN